METNTVPNKTQRARLRKLRKFIANLPARKVDLNTVRNECGSVACIMGWLPVVFPRTFVYDKNYLDLGFYVIDRHSGEGAEDCAYDFLGTTWELFEAKAWEERDLTHKKAALNRIDRALRGQHPLGDDEDPDYEERYAEN